MRASYRPIPLFGLALLLAVLLAGPVAAQEIPPGQTITVQEGENLLDVAVRTGKSVLCIRLANDLPPLPGLTGVSQLFIPNDCAPYLNAGAGTAASDQTSADESYTVQRGDRLAKIAEEFGVTVTCLARANRIANPDLIYVGQEMVIPGSCQGGGGGGESLVTGDDLTCQFDRNPDRVVTSGLYTVQAGDALDFIACDFGIALECLLASNPQIDHRGRIAIGEQLTISLSCPPWQDSTLPPTDTSG